MKINSNKPIEGLKKVIERLFEVDLVFFSHEQYHPQLAQGLKELYEIDAFFAQKNCVFQTIRFFCNQDRLVPYEDLALNETRFTFVQENQRNWQCQTELGTDKVYFCDRVEPTKSHQLSYNIDAFLTTFALQEIGFNLHHCIGLESKDISDIEAYLTKIEPIWVQKKYIYGTPCSYYLVDDDCLLMYAGMNILATNNEAKLAYYQSVLPHYVF